MIADETEKLSEFPERTGDASACDILKEERKRGMEGKLYEAWHKGGSHVYVVLDGMKNPDLPLNGIPGLDIKVGYIRTTGKDVTEELMGDEKDS